VSEPGSTAPRGRLLDAVERIGNRLPDPALLFVLLLLAVWVFSSLLADSRYDEIDPRTGGALVVHDLLTPAALTTFLSSMVSNFVSFPPFGVVLLAMLGIGVADHTGFIGAALRGLLSVTSKRVLTPMLIVVAIASHSAVDAGYVLVIPLGAVIFRAAGRHPLAGIAAAFAGVSGGFSANFVPSALDPMLQGISQAAAQLVDPGITLNPLNNYFFTASSTLLIVGLGWFLTDRVVEPRLARLEVDGELAGTPSFEPLSAAERRGLVAAASSMGILIALLFASVWPESSAWRGASGALSSADAPLMKSIVPIIFLLFLVPGVVHGWVAGTVRSHRDLVDGMSRAMSGLGYYVVMAFFAAQFIAEFGRSNLGALVALKGAAGLEALALPGAVTLAGVVLITTLVNLFIGSSSAKWALLAPVLVPMLMQLDIGPDLTQAAYRVGDSSTNIITPLMPYFPLVVVYCRRYVQATGIGTLVAMMLPYAAVFLAAWTTFLLLFWLAGIPLGVQATYGYPS
jgi:aminobenzoyl-glutamate transport protein